MRRSRQPLATGAFAGLFVAILLGPSVAGLPLARTGPAAPPSSPDPRPDPSPPKGPLTAPSPPAGPRIAPHPASDLLTVNSTVVAFNGTSEPGAYAPANVLSPGPIATDGPDGLLFVAEEEGFDVQVVNESRGLVVSTLAFPTSVEVTDLAYAPDAHRLFAVDAASGDLYAKNTTGARATVGGIALPGGGDAEAVGYDPATGEVLATEAAPDRLAVLNATTLHVVGDFPVGSTPIGAVRAGSSDLVFVADEAASTITVVNTSSGANWTVGVGSSPTQVAYDPANASVWVVDAGAYSVTRILLASNTSSSYDLPAVPSGIAYDPTSRSVLVSSASSEELELFNGSTLGLMREVPWYFEYATLAIAPQTGWIYTASALGSVPEVVGVAEPNGTFLGNLSVGAEPSFVSSPPTGAWVESTDSQDTAGYLLNATDLALTGRPTYPSGVELVGSSSSAYDPATDELYLAEGVDGALDVVNATSGALVGEFTNPSGSTSQVAFDPGSGRLFVVGSFDVDRIYVLDPAHGELLGEIGNGGSVDMGGLAVDPSTEELFVVEETGSEVAVYNTTTLALVYSFAYPGGTSPELANYDPSTGLVYVSSAIAIRGYNPRTYALQALIDLGPPNRVFATYILFSPTTGDLYVVDPTNDSILVVNPVSQALVANVSLDTVPGTAAFDAALGALVVTGGPAGTLLLVPTSATPPPRVDSFRPVPAAPSVGEPFHLEADIAGGSGPYTFGYTGLPDGCAPEDTADLACSGGPPGNYTVLLSVEDAQGIATNATLSFSITGKVTLELTSFRAVPDPVDEGALALLGVNATTDYGPLDYRFTDLPSGCSSADSANLTCQPDATGTFEVEVLIEGPGGASAQGSLALTVVPAVQVTKFTGNLSRVEVGGSVRLNLTATSGVTPYTYSYTGLPPGCEGGNSSYLICGPTGVGRFTIVGTVTDPGGGFAAAQVDLEVAPAGTLPPRIDAFTATPADVVNGSSFFLSVTLSVDYPFTLGYQGLPPGCSGQNATGFSCRPDATGTYRILVSVTSPWGGTANATATVSVTAPPTVHLTPSSPSVPWAWVVGIVLVAVVAVAAALAIRARRPPGGPATGGGEAAEEPPPPEAGPGPFSEGADAGGEEAPSPGPGEPDQ